MFTRVTSAESNAAEKAAIRVFQSNRIASERLLEKNMATAITLHLIVGASRQMIEQSTDWRCMKDKFRVHPLNTYKPLIDAGTSLEYARQSLRNCRRDVTKTNLKAEKNVDVLEEIHRTPIESRGSFSEVIEKIRSDLKALFKQNKHFASRILRLGRLADLNQTEKFRIRLQRTYRQIIRSLKKENDNQLQIFMKVKRNALRVPRCVVIATDTDIWAQAVEILDTHRSLQEEIGEPVTQLEIHVIEDTWTEEAESSVSRVAVVDVEYFFERMIDAMGDHLFQDPEAGKRAGNEVNPTSSSACFEGLHAIRVHQFRNELYEWIRQIPVDTISRRKIRNYCERELDSRTKELVPVHDVNVSAIDSGTTEMPSYLVETLILEGLQTVIPHTLRRFKRSVLGSHKRYRKDPHATLEMFCNNYRGIGYGSVNLSDIRDQLLKSHPSKDRYLRTMALLLLGGIVPKKDEAAYKQILLAQQEWEFLDARFAKSGPISFFQRMGGWRHLISLGTNTHYSRREDPFLKDNPAIRPKTFLRSERLRADLFYFIDEICRNPDECQPTKIVAFARNIASLCGTDPDQWRTWLGPPEVWLRKT